MSTPWMYDFLGHPSDTDMAAQCLSMIRTFEKEPKTNTGSVLSLGAFMGNAWAHWPDKLEGWFRQLLDQVEGQKGRELLYTALFMSHADEAHALLQSLDSAPTDEEAESLLQLQAVPRPNPPEIEVIEPYHLDLHWGGYLGSGNDIHLERILEQILHVTGNSQSSMREKSNGMAAIWSIQACCKQSVHVDLGLTKVFHRRPALAALYPVVLDEYFKNHPGY